MGEHYLRSSTPDPVAGLGVANLFFFQLVETLYWPIKDSEDKEDHESDGDDKDD